MNLLVKVSRAIVFFLFHWGSYVGLRVSAVLSPKQFSFRQRTAYGCDFVHHRLCGSQETTRCSFHVAAELTYRVEAPINVDKDAVESNPKNALERRWIAGVGCHETLDGMVEVAYPVQLLPRMNVAEGRRGVHRVEECLRWCVGSAIGGVKTVSARGIQCDPPLCQESPDDVPPPIAHRLLFPMLGVTLPDNAATAAVRHFLR